MKHLEKPAHPLRGFLHSALRLIALRPAAPASNADHLGAEKDTVVQNDHLIPLTDGEENQTNSLNATLRIIDSIADSLNSEQDDGEKTPLVLRAFKRRFLG